MDGFTYDDAGRLTQVTRDGVAIDARQYDAAGRVIRSGAPASANSNRLRELGAAPEYRTYHYDSAGNLQRMKAFASNGDQLEDIYYRAIPEKVSNVGYDGAGNLLGYTVVPRSGANAYYERELSEQPLSARNISWDELIMAPRSDSRAEKIVK